MRKKIIGLLTAGSIILTPVCALAANTAVNVAITPGTLSLTAPASVNMTSVDLNTMPDSGATSTGSASSFTIKDHRSGTNGWTASYTITDFSDGGTNSIDVTNLTAAPSTLTAVGNSSLTGVTLGSGGALTDTDNNGTSDSFTLVNATSGNGKGRYNCDLDLSLSVDVSTTPANYTATVVATIV